MEVAERECAGVAKKQGPEEGRGEDGEHCRVKSAEEGTGYGEAWTEVLRL
jgi:hypothetical protein